MTPLPSIDPRPAQLAPDDTVITPSGRCAIVIDVYRDIGEVLVQWPDGERARFRYHHLKAAP